MTVGNQYAPDYCVTPSEVVADYLEAHGETLAPLVVKDVLSLSAALYLLSIGEVPITPEIADELARGLRRPAHFWKNLDRHYREDRERQSVGGA